jgi:hypothetical protein
MDNKNSSRGIGVMTVVQIVFIILKLLKLIDWSWWIVLIPLWIDLALLAILILAIVIIKPWRL